MSELVPFRSSKINMWKSSLLIPAAVTAAVCIVLFSSMQNFYLVMKVLTFYLLFVICYASYAYSGLKSNLLIYIFPAVAVWLAFQTPVFYLIATLFRDILPGTSVEGENVFMSFVHYFFGAGMAEELTKALAALIGMFLALQGKKKAAVAGAPASSSFIDYFKVSTPLEGIMFGMVAGASFVYIETLGQYVPNVVAAVAKVGGPEAGFAYGFSLLFPRVLQSIIGHMGWSAIFGYFIGLAAMYPRSMIKLLAIGWLVSAFLHGLWDAIAIYTPGLWISGALSLLAFVAVFVKAKQLDTARRGFVQSDSIIVGAEPVPNQQFDMGEAKATAWGGLANLMNVVNTGAAAVQAAAAQRAAAPADLAQAPNAVAKPTFALAAGSARFGIMAGQTLDLAQLFPGQGLPAQCLAEVTVNPKDASQLGLKNLSGASWSVTTESGSTASAPKGRNVKLTPGAKITIGKCVIQVQSV